MQWKTFFAMSLMTKLTLTLSDPLDGV